MGPIGGKQSNKREDIHNLDHFQFYIINEFDIHFLGETMSAKSCCDTEHLW